MVNYDSLGSILLDKNTYSDDYAELKLLTFGRRQGAYGISTTTSRDPVTLEIYGVPVDQHEPRMDPKRGEDTSGGYFSVGNMIEVLALHDLEEAAKFKERYDHPRTELSIGAGRRQYPCLRKPSITVKAVDAEHGSVDLSCPRHFNQRHFTEAVRRAGTANEISYLEALMRSLKMEFESEDSILGLAPKRALDFQCAAVRILQHARRRPLEGAARALMLMQDDATEAEVEDAMRALVGMAESKQEILLGFVSANIHPKALTKIRARGILGLAQLLPWHIMEPLSSDVLVRGHLLGMLDPSVNYELVFKNHEKRVKPWTRKTPSHIAARARKWDEAAARFWRSRSAAIEVRHDMLRAMGTEQAAFAAWMSAYDPHVKALFEESKLAQIGPILEKAMYAELLGDKPTMMILGKNRYDPQALRARKWFTDAQ